LDIRDAGTDRLPWAKVSALLWYLPPESAVRAEVKNHQAEAEKAKQPKRVQATPEKLDEMFALNWSPTTTEKE